MGVDVSRFTKKNFIYTVPLELHREFFTPFADNLPFSLDAFTYDQLYEFLSQHGDELPPDAMMALHEISGLASDEGYDLLVARANEFKTPIVFDDDDREIGELPHQTMAMLCYLRYNFIYLAAQNSFFEAKVRSVSEYNGIEPLEYEEIDERELNFKTEVEKYFEERYKGRFCQVDRFEENGRIHYSIAHGKHKSSLRVVEDSNVRTAAFREEKQDYLNYNPVSGKLCVSATSAEEREYLAKLFARVILDQPGYFDHEDSQNNYTIAPLLKAGLDFRFEYSSDPEVTSIAITEIRFAEGRRGSQAVTFCSTNVLEQLRKHHEIDIRTDPIVYIKVRFAFTWKGKKKSRNIMIKPPSVAQFDRRLFGYRMIEHLRKNGFVYDRSVK